MNKTDLISFMAKEASITKADAARALKAFLDAVAKDLKKGDNTTLIGFGTFAVTKRAARKGRNPRTGKEINIPASKVVRFRAGKALKETVNK